MTLRNALVAILAVACIAMPLLVVVVDASRGWPSGVFHLAFAPAPMAFAMVGWLLVVRRPGNVIGPLCLLFGFVFAAYFPIDLLVRDGSTAVVVELAATFSAASDAAGFIVVAMILILFPDGRMPGPRWRWTIPVAVGGAAVSVIGLSLAAGPLAAFPTVVNPIGVEGVPWGGIGEVGYVALIALLVAAVAALRSRWRHGGSVERAQIKWVSAASVVVLVTEVANIATFDPSDPLGAPIPVFLASTGTALVPVAIGIAILRYRLYEIDRLVSRTIGWAVVTAILAAVFVGVIIGLQAVLDPVTNNNTLAVAASTLIAAALFQPLRARVQRAVDRRFSRARVSAERVVAGFAARTRDEVDLSELLGATLGATRASVSPSHAGVWLRRDR